MAFEHYIVTGGKRLRCGFTTGSCAAMAASACAARLVHGTWPEKVSLLTPKGLRVEAVPEEMTEGEGWASCGIRKDAGDDIDMTAGTLIMTRVRLTDAESGIRIEGGEGIGRVTRPGLDQPVGAAAINSVPRRMITEAVRQVLEEMELPCGAEVIVSAPEGERIGRKTFNPVLGIEGGISILGTSGIVEPMSLQALIDTMAVQIRQEAAMGHQKLILVPGNYGMDYLQARQLDSIGVPVVKCSNFIGDALDEAAAHGFREILLVGHAGKLVKLAGGIMNTHSRYADCRTELFCAHAAVCGASPELCARLMACATSDACIELLDQAGLRDRVLQSLTERIQTHLSRRAGEEILIGAVLFSQVYGELGRTTGADELLHRWLG